MNEEINQFSTATCIRIKPGTRIFEETDELLFIRSYGKAVTIIKDPIVMRLLEKIGVGSNKEDLLADLAAEIGLEKHWIEKLVERLIEQGVIENYLNDTINNSLYTRHETQLSFFDLLNPVSSVEERLNWQVHMSRFQIIIIGIGGIGNYVVLSLAAMGIGKLILIDGDNIEESNLNRQVIFGEYDVGEKKTVKAANKIKKLYKGCHVRAIDTIITTKEEASLHLLTQGTPDLVFICADQPPALPIWINEIANEYKFPFIKCSYQGSTGFIGPLVEPGGKLFSEIVEILDDDETGIISRYNQTIRHASSSPSNAVFANIAVLESIKYLLKIPTVNILERRMLFNLENMTISYE